MALTTRTVNISLRIPTPSSALTVRFLPDLAAGNGDVLLEKVYETTMTGGLATTLQTGSIVLPCRPAGAGTISYRVQFPRVTGINEHYIYLEYQDGTAISLSDLMVLSQYQGVVLSLDDLTDVTFPTVPVAGQILSYNGSNWINAAAVPSTEPATQVVVTVRNDEATPLTVGTLIYVTGANGTHVLAKRARADAELTSSKTLGMVIETIAPNDDGRVLLSGTVDNVNTSGFPAGTALWLSAVNAGQFVGVMPTQPNHSVFVGWVARENINNGRIVLKIQNGYELQELHNVLISSVANRDGLFYDTATSLWKNMPVAKTVRVVAGTNNNVSPTPNADTTDVFTLTALSVDPTFQIPSGTPVNGQKLMIRIKDDGTARALAWNAIYVAGGTSLPTTTVINKTMHLGFIYNTDNALNKWMLVAKAEEA